MVKSIRTRNIHSSLFSKFLHTTEMPSKDQNEQLYSKTLLLPSVKKSNTNCRVKSSSSSTILQAFRANGSRTKTKANR